MLKKRYMNIKYRMSGESSKSKKGQQCVLEASEKDSESLLKEHIQLKGNSQQKKHLLCNRMLPLNKCIFHSTMITDAYFQQKQTIDGLHNALDC